jgi:hypothetical protein
MVQKILDERGRGWKVALARHCGVEGASVTNWFKDNGNAPEHDNILKILEFAQLDPAELAPELVSDHPKTGIVERDRAWIAASLRAAGHEAVAFEVASEMQLHHKSPQPPARLLNAAIDLAKTAEAELAGEPPPLHPEDEKPSTHPPPKPPGRGRQ